MNSAKQLAQQFIGAAKRYPDRAPAILRDAAKTFAGLSSDPQNAHASKELQNMALDFAGAASRANERPPTMDDFTDLLQETRLAYKETDDPMDLVSRRREIHEDRTRITPGQISIAPESFTRDATLGRSANIKFAPTNEERAQGIQQEQTVAFWQGIKKEAQAITVDVGLVSPPVATALEEPFNVRPFGIVEYGSDGNKTSAKFDIGSGQRLTVVGNYVSVNVGMDPPRPGSPTTSILVGASIGTFAAPSQAPLIATQYIDDLGAGAATDFIQIPKKAVLLLPIQSNGLLGDTAEVRFFGYGGGALTLSRIFYTQAVISMNPIPLPGDVSFVRLINGAGGARSFQLPFQLSL